MPPKPSIGAFVGFSIHNFVALHRFLFLPILLSPWCIPTAIHPSLENTRNYYICSFMGYDDLDVVDPTSGEAKQAETDLTDVRIWYFYLHLPFLLIKQTHPK